LAVLRIRLTIDFRFANLRPTCLNPMTKRQLFLTFIPFVLLVMLGLALLPRQAGRVEDPAPVQPTGARYTFAVIAAEAVGEMQYLRPFTAFLNTFLGEVNIQLEPVVLSSGEVFSNATALEGIDFLLASPYPVYRLVTSGEMQPIARQWRNGLAEYGAVIVVARDSGIWSIADLEGRHIAFESPHSSSAFFLPATDIAGAGLALVAAGEAAPPEPHVRHSFSGWDRESITWLINGRVEAAAVGAIEWDKLPAAMRDQLRILHKSELLPRHVLAMRSEIPALVEDTVLNLLIDLETSNAGREVLAAFHETRRFDLIPYEAELRQQMVERLQRIPWEH
jgi:phosphonate transport system substrate-binding protein